MNLPPLLLLKAFLTSRLRAEQERARLAQVRRGLSEEEKKKLDDELSAAFLGLGHSSRSVARNPERVVSLVKAGALPASFDDYELCDGGNLATVFRD